MTLSPPNDNLSLIVPAFNEESNIAVLIEKSLQVLPKYFSQFEIIVVDDGSKDKTAEVVEQWSRRNSTVKLIRHSVNMGVGSVLHTALSAAKYEWIFQIPGDNQFDINEIEKFVPEIPDSDVVQGWRVNLQQSFYRNTVTQVYRTLLRILFGLNLKDHSWVKMFRREVMISCPITTEGFFGEIEILIRAKRKGFRFAEVGVHTQKRLYGESSAKSFARVLRTFIELVRFRLRE